MSKLAGKVAVVTGASKGIGASIAKHLGAAGASVVVNYASSRAGADQVVGEITAAGGKAVAVQGDVSKREDIDRLFAETLAAFGKVDILVNNAGVYEFGPIDEFTEEHYHRQFNLNVLGLLLATKKAVSLFGADGGNVINISSMVAVEPLPGASVYSATKGAVDAITKSLAKELGSRRIRVNSINPGAIRTEGVEAAGFVGSDLYKKIENDTPLGRIGVPEDVGPVAVFLASEDSRWVTGEVLQVAGGLR